MAKMGSLDPHVFALAEAAYRSIVEEKINQVTSVYYICITYLLLF